MKGIVVFATGERGVAVVERLLADGHEVASIVVPPGSSPPGLAELAKRAGCHLSSPENINSPVFLDLLSHQGVELSVVSGFPTIFRQSLIGLPRHGTINLHAGRLPAYRGGSPLQWQVINGETQAGISVIRMDDGIDTGPILAEATFDIPPEADITDLQASANQRFAELTARCVAEIADGSLTERTQEGQASYWHQRNPADGRLDFSAMTAADAHNMIRAITRPYPGAFAFWGRQVVRIWKAAIAPLDMRGVPGRIVWLQGKGPYIICKEGALLAIEYEIEGEDEKLKSGVRLM